MMKYDLNTTNNYHINDLNSLGWELTVCNALYPAASPCRKVLLENKSFGVLLYQFLEKLIPFDNVSRVLEVGGGLGYLMADFLSLQPRWKATMIDISPHLLAEQKKYLQQFTVNFWQKDILQIDTSSLSSFDLVIMNENLGDLPTLVADPEGQTDSASALPYLNRAQHFTQEYNLKMKQNENINIGAIEVLEKFCRAGIKYIYLSEHSCEAVAPDILKPYLHWEKSDNPEKIALKGHNEYTIKFSCLQQIAKKFNYKSIRGPFADFLPLDLNDKVRTALQQASSISTEQEIIQQFVYDLFKYEYLVLIKGGKS